ncbi:MAG: hypothetical protein AMJ93_08530 [Anaerolineae bacterium SM23_84]|nr:MAG: hypothetical protein AMJ93_08530 [Anaerolineae bacterium SM23_84]
MIQSSGRRADALEFVSLRQVSLAAFHQVEGYARLARFASGKAQPPLLGRVLHVVKRVAGVEWIHLR